MAAFRRKLDYPQGFVDKVRAAFPHDKELHALIGAGSVYSVEQMLKRSGNVELSSEFARLLADQPKQLSMAQELFAGAP